MGRLGGGGADEGILPGKFRGRLLPGLGVGHGGVGGGQIMHPPVDPAVAKFNLDSGGGRQLRRAGLFVVEQMAAGGERQRQDKGGREEASHGCVGTGFDGLSNRPRAHLFGFVAA